MSQQLNLFSKGTAEKFAGPAYDPLADPATEANAVDEMFAADSRYRSSREFSHLLNFIAHLPQYSAFNGFYCTTRTRRFPMWQQHAPGRASLAGI